MRTSLPPAPTDSHRTEAEVAAHAILELVATHPGQFGRLRTARIVAGYAVPINDEDMAQNLAPFTAIVKHWTIRDTVDLVDAMVSGALLAQTSGIRPTLVLTRAGHRALDALQAAASSRFGGPIVES